MTACLSGQPLVLVRLLLSSVMGPARVLIIDDSPTILKVVGAILARHGYEPATARDGLAGIELLRKSPRFDIILLDYSMPRMNGYQFCREIRSNPVFRSLPVVLMSAKGDKIRGQFVQQTGAIDAITKPFDACALIAVLEGALAKTAEARARLMPESLEEEYGAESAVSVRHRRMRTMAAVAQHVARAVTPAVLALSPAERDSEASVLAATARAVSPEVIDVLAKTLQNYDLVESFKEMMGGDIAAIPLAEILQILHMQRQTGVLRVTSGRASITVYLHLGLIDLVQSRGLPDEFLLGRYFVELGAVTREQLADVLATKTAGEALLGATLLEASLITEDQRREALLNQSCELVYELLRWRFGRFSFTREPFRPEVEEATLGLGVSGLVLEGFRRVDEWRLMEGSINNEQVICVDDDARAALDEASLPRSQRLVLQVINGARTVAEIVRESMAGSFNATKAVYDLMDARVLKPRA